MKSDERLNEEGGFKSKSMTSTLPVPVLCGCHPISDSCLFRFLAQLINAVMHAHLQKTHSIHPNTQQAS